MQFVETHLTKHHLFHAPHQWFWAVLLSPIHAAEMHYQKRYHLTFVHAKKLFVFDLLFLLSIIVLGIGSLFWYSYDPTVTDAVLLTIDTSADRVKSGEQLTYTIRYANESDQTLTDPVITLNLPDGFVLNTVTPSDLFDAKTKTLTLPTLYKKANGVVSINGWFYGEPEKTERMGVTLSYRQAERTTREEKQVAILATLRGSLMTTELVIPETIVSIGNIPFSIELRGFGDTPTEYRLPLTFGAYATLGENTTVSVGRIEQQTWIIPQAVNTPAKLEGQLVMFAPEHITTKDIQLVPSITVAGKTFPQTSVKKTLTVVHPKILVATVWKKSERVANPGENVEATLVLQNTGNTTINNLGIRLPITPFIDTTRLKQLQPGLLEKDVFVFSTKSSANLLSLPPNSETSFDIIIPIKKQITTGEQLTYTLNPLITGQIPSVPSGQYHIRAQSEPVKISSALDIHAELRYFTVDGDQVGRGPLPPRVGKETKYWAFLHLYNKTNTVKEIALSAVLAPHVAWTGKSSVSHGKQLTYFPDSRTINWKAPTILPHSQAGVYLELAFTPTETEKGLTPRLLTNISASGVDDFTGVSLSTGYPPLDISMPTDEEANQAGIVVE